MKKLLALAVAAVAAVLIKRKIDDSARQQRLWRDATDQV